MRGYFRPCGHAKRVFGCAERTRFGERSAHRGRSTQNAPAGATTPQRCKCALVNKGLMASPDFGRFAVNSAPRKMGQGNQKCLTSAPERSGANGKSSKTAPRSIRRGANPVLVPLLVLHLLSVFKLPNLLQDFLPFFFWGWAVFFVMHLFLWKRLD